MEEVGKKSYFVEFFLLFYVADSSNKCNNANNAKNQRAIIERESIWAGSPIGATGGQLDCQGPRRVSLVANVLSLLSLSIVALQS